MLNFAHPWVLLLLLIIPAIALWLWKRQRPATLQYSDLRLVRHLPKSWKVRFRWLPAAAYLLVLILLIISIARPQSSHERDIIHGEGVDIVLALDISGSMAALDFEPENRLEAAKLVIDDFIEGRRYDRIGLAVFAREAFSQCPPTFDYDVLEQLLSEIELGPELGLNDGTAIGMGLAQGVAMLAESEAESRVVILLTDGANNAGQIDPLTAAQTANALEVKVYTIGMGKPGMVPFPAMDIWGRETTQLIESDLDEEVLQEIARTTGALYFRATDTAGLQQVYQQIDRMEKSDVEVQVFVRHKELVAWVLIPAVVFLLLGLLLRNTIFRTLP